MLINAATDAARLSVAPMMDWTDRHCRFLHRLLSRHVLLYTEMVTAAAVVNGDRDRLLGYSPAEHPVALQLGGSEPELLAEAVRVAADYGYDEINLNVGCPSDRVQSGAFGACLMREPALVAECCAAMMDAAPQSIEITVKCRIGVDEQDPEQALPAFIDAVADAGVNHFAIHARKAWLEGLSPKQNRDIPPLDHDLVLRMKQRRPELRIAINGGITSLDMVEQLLADGLDGVMVGRAAYHNPADILCDADPRIFGTGVRVKPEDAVQLMLPYIEERMSRGDRLNQITRHMMTLFQGRPGARQWRRTLSENAHLPGAGPDLVLTALSCIAPEVVAA
jgi:tRNA-dihydrouridine synthase A